MDAILDVVVKIAIMVSLGFLLRKLNIITEELQKGLTNLLLTAILPFSIIASSGYIRTGALTRGLLIVGAAAVIYYAVAIILMKILSDRLPFGEKKKRIFITMTVFQNTGFVGFPLMQALYGSEGLLLAVVFNMAYNLFMFSYGVQLLSGEKADIKKFFLNPISIASVVAILIFISPFRLPNIIASPVADVGAMTIPISMMIIGASLAPIPLRSILSDWRAYLVSFIRLLALPGLMFLAMLFLPVDPVTKSVIVLMAALPCGSMNVMFSEKYDCEPEFAAKTVVQSMLLMTITLPLMIFLCSRVFA
jgi:hypothetical protein